MSCYLLSLFRFARTLVGLLCGAFSCSRCVFVHATIDSMVDSGKPDSVFGWQYLGCVLVAHYFHCDVVLECVCECVASFTLLRTFRTFIMCMLNLPTFTRTETTSHVRIRRTTHIASWFHWHESHVFNHDGDFASTNTEFDCEWQYLNSLCVRSCCKPGGFQNACDLRKSHSRLMKVEIILLCYEVCL